MLKGRLSDFSSFGSGLDCLLFFLQEIEEQLLEEKFEEERRITEEFGNSTNGRLRKKIWNITEYPETSLAAKVEFYYISVVLMRLNNDISSCMLSSPSLLSFSQPSSSSSPPSQSWMNFTRLLIPRRDRSILYIFHFFVPALYLFLYLGCKYQNQYYIEQWLHKKWSGKKKLCFFYGTKSTLKLQGILVLTILDHITMIFFTLGKWRGYFMVKPVAGMSPGLIPLKCIFIFTSELAFSLVF